MFKRDTFEMGRICFNIFASQIFLDNFIYLVGKCGVHCIYDENIWDVLKIMFSNSQLSMDKLQEILLGAVELDQSKSRKKFE